MAKKITAEECLAKCEKEIAALKKEIAGLKKELAKKSAGGADPRVDAVINAIKVIYGDYYLEKKNIKL